MKMVFLIIFILVFFPGCSPPSSEEFVIGENICSYYGETVNSTAVEFTSLPQAEQIIASIIATVGLQPRFEIRKANVPNAAAVIQNGKRYILYNPDFINTINDRTGSHWAAVSILAHEIGHHLNGHTLDGRGSRPDIELEADEFSGFVLHKLGASLNDAQVAMKIAASVKASHTHPARASRLAAIARGWNNAGEKIIAEKKSNSVKNIDKPAIVKNPQETERTALEEKYIACNVHFKADSKGRYFVTIRNNLVKATENDIYIIGRRAESNVKGYPYMFYDKQFNYLYISASGKIYNGNGNNIGHLRCR